jgi:superoxide dismutase, Fe-Mn family
MFLGHINHSLFWKNLAPEGPSSTPSGVLKEALEKDFGSVAAFKKLMSEKTAAVQGSGWGWLASSIFFAGQRILRSMYCQGYNPASKKLEIVTTPNQDPLLSAFD